MFKALNAENATCYMVFVHVFALLPPCCGSQHMGRLVWRFGNEDLPCFPEPAAIFPWDMVTFSICAVCPSIRECKLPALVLLVCMQRAWGGCDAVEMLVPCKRGVFSWSVLHACYLHVCSFPWQPCRWGQVVGAFSGSMKLNPAPFLMVDKFWVSKL